MPRLKSQPPIGEVAGAGDEPVHGGDGQVAVDVEPRSVARRRVRRTRLYDTLGKVGVV